MGGVVSASCLRQPAPPPPDDDHADLHKLWQLVCRDLPPPERPPIWAPRLDEALLTWGEFQLVFSTAGPSGPIVKRIFDMLDSDRRGAISRDEFVRGLLPLTSARAPVAEKLRFVFRCLDLDDSQSISREELLVHLHAHISRAGARGRMAALAPAQLEAVVAHTFDGAQLDGSGQLGWDGFIALLQKRPLLLEQLARSLSLDVNKAIAHLVLGTDDDWMMVGVAEAEAVSAALSSRTSHRRTSSAGSAATVLSARLSLPGSPRAASPAPAAVVEAAERRAQPITWAKPRRPHGAGHRRTESQDSSYLASTVKLAVVVP
jgi:Ca2+-binding EF-hand superfamily protein